MTADDLRIIFLNVHNLLSELQIATEAALDQAIDEGRLATRLGGITAELQWPWYGWDPLIDKSREFPFRFFIEARPDKQEPQGPASEAGREEPEEPLVGEAAPGDPSVQAPTPLPEAGEE